MAAAAAPPRRTARFHPSDLQELLFAYGDNAPSLPATISILDEILTDFLMETCHAAALSASYSRRQKIKVDDFKWVLRSDGVLLGRVLEQMWKDKGLKEERKVMDFDKVGAEGASELAGIAELGGAAGEMAAKKGKGGRRRKRRADEESTTATTTGGEMKRRRGESED